MPYKSCRIRTLSPSAPWSLSGVEGPTECNDFLGPSAPLRDQKIRSFIALRSLLRAQRLSLSTRTQSPRENSYTLLQTNTSFSRMLLA